MKWRIDSKSSTKHKIILHPHAPRPNEAPLSSYDFSSPRSKVNHWSEVENHPSREAEGGRRVVVIEEAWASKCKREGTLSKGTTTRSRSPIMAYVWHARQLERAVDESGSRHFPRYIERYGPSISPLEPCSTSPRIYMRRFAHSLRVATSL